MKSFCIKTNNEQILNYLLKNLESSPIEEIYYISKEFKLYKNIIIHYKGTNFNDFLGFLTETLTNCIILFYEPLILKRIINYNFFYFDDFEKNIIEKNCYDCIIANEYEFRNRKNEISTPLLSYINENKSMILDGFVNFRLQNYHITLEEIVDFAVNQYIIEKEYSEFINLLKIYIDSKIPQTNIIHLVYTNGDSVLLTEDKKILNLHDDIFNLKYLSDISFSSNDYTLNALLTLLPKKIQIHLIGCEDEFINTLKLIFGSKISICMDCNICRTYNILNNVNNNK